MRRIGIDVGGTNTDAVLIENGKVARAVKAPTSEDVTTGILEALARLSDTGLVATGKIDAVMIGTTHFINAVVQRRHLSKVAALRLAMPASACMRSMATSPPPAWSRRRISRSWPARSTTCSISRRSMT